MALGQKDVQVDHKDEVNKSQCAERQPQRDRQRFPSFSGGRKMGGQDDGKGETGCKKTGTRHHDDIQVEKRPQARLAPIRQLTDRDRPGPQAVREVPERYEQTQPRDGLGKGRWPREAIGERRKVK